MLTLYANGSVFDETDKKIKKQHVVVDQRGHVMAIEDDLAQIIIGPRDKIVDCSDLILTSGLIDMHAHIAYPMIGLAVHPDEAGVFNGVTTAVDAGSMGWRNFEVLKSKTNLKYFVHLAPDGERSLPERDFDQLEISRLLACFDEHEDVIVGLKMRAVMPHIKTDLKLIELSKDITAKVNKPMMIHIGDSSQTSISREQYQKTIDILNMLEKDDIVTHVYTPHPGGLFTTSLSDPAEYEAEIDVKLKVNMLKAIENATQRGVCFDASGGMGQLSFKAIQLASEVGFKHNFIGTDIVKLPEERNFLKPHFYHIPIIVSKLLALGYSLEDVLCQMTAAPKRYLKLDEGLAIGKKAAITALKLEKVPTLLHSGLSGELQSGTQYLMAHFTVRGSEMFKTHDDIRSHRPMETEILRMQKRFMEVLKK